MYTSYTVYGTWFSRLKSKNILQAHRSQISTCSRGMILPALCSLVHRAENIACLLAWRVYYYSARAHGSAHISPFECSGCLGRFVWFFVFAGFWQHPYSCCRLLFRLFQTNSAIIRRLLPFQYHFPRENSRHHHLHSHPLQHTTTTTTN